MDALAPAVSVLELNDWLTWQLAKWDTWQAGQATDWLRLPSGNSAWPGLAALFAHAFAPLHRYGDFILGAEAVHPPELGGADWAQLHAWAARCLARHREACGAAADDPERQLSYQSRTAGTLVISARMALAQGATHCAWHLAGITHLLRHAGIEPPQQSDLLFWALEQQQGHNAAAG